MGYILQQVAEEIATPLSLYNKSLDVGLVPTAWKRSNVTTIHKNGQTDNPGTIVPYLLQYRLWQKSLRN